MWVTAQTTAYVWECCKNSVHFHCSNTLLCLKTLLQTFQLKLRTGHHDKTVAELELGSNHGGLDCMVCLVLSLRNSMV